jgi:hypothetical protein
MNMFLNTGTAKWLLVALIAGFSGGCGTAINPGTPPAVGSVRPTAEERKQQREADKVLDRLVKVQGGKAAISKVAGVKTELEVQFGPGWPMLTMITKEASGGRFSWELLTPGFGSFFTVSDGRVVLMQNEKLGAGFLDNRTASMAMSDSDPQQVLKIAALYPTRRRLEDVVEKDVRLQVISLSGPGGNEKWFIDAVTGLRVRVERPDVAMMFSDFKKVGDFTVAMSAENSHGVHMKVKSISFDEHFADSVFYVDPVKVAEAEKIRSILLRQVASVGGEALDRVKTRSSTAVVELEKLGMTFEMNIRQKRPNFVLIEQNIPGMGKLFQGFDGKTGWASSEMQGYRELKGPELLQLLSMSDLGADTRLAEICPLRKLVGERELPHGKATGIELGSLAGSNGTYWFENETGRMVRVESAIVTGPNSHVTMVIDMDDFRQVDGVWVPFTTRMDNPTLKMVTRMKSVENNIALDDEIFKPRTDD